MNSLYELDPKWKKLLKTDNFLGGLTVNEFVQELSKDHRNDVLIDANTKNLPTNEKDQDAIREAIWKQLDPKPYIRTFESTLKELKNLNEETLNKRQYFSEQVATQEVIHSENVIKLSKDLHTTLLTFDKLDDRLTNVTQVVSPLGDKLETAIKKKQNYIQSVELIRRYNDFYSMGKSDIVEQLRLSKNWKLNLKSVKLMKNLLILSSKLETSSIPKTINTKLVIEKYSEMMENELLENFNSAYRENNFTKLNEIAIILNNFNGGVNVIQSFINQHDYFIDTKQIDLENEFENVFIKNVKFKEQLIDFENHSVIIETSMQNLINDVETVIKNESKIVKRVFEEKATHVIQLFIQRVFAQKIEPRFEVLLRNSLSISNLAYVRILHGLFTLFGKFTKSLIDYFQLLEIDDSNQILSTTLEQCFADLFSHYLYDRSKYFGIEKRSLEAILVDMTSKFTVNYDKEINKRVLLDKYKEKLSTNVDAFMHSPRGNTHSRQDSTSRSKLSQFNSFLKTHLDKDHLSLNRTNTLSDSFNNSSSSTQYDVANNSSSLVNSSFTASDIDNSPNSPANYSLNDVDSMLKCVVESTARVMELIPNKAHLYILEILKIMFLGIVDSYMEIALEIAYWKICKVDINKTAGVVNLNFLKFISMSTEILDLLSISIKSIFLPLLNNSPEIKAQIIEMTNSQIQKMEILINIILQETITVISTKFSAILCKQKKKDFVPKSQELLDQDTLPAIEIVNILNLIFEQSSKFLKGKNLQTFLTLIGEELYGLLLSHYSHFQVNSIGGVVVTKDIIGYQTAIEDWGVASLIDKFATLRELANLFTVQPELLESLTKEGHLADIGRDIIQSYISNREDFNHDNFINSVKLNFR
ncbi:AHL_G0036790.mRNA.1.CDS.1 [Saccharomyces cerevisiae]|nr:Sec10p [Saccharomyces cerevisiae YJM1252]AJV73910.1 Sec10p [Saccharomyces cerevisiae YJM248]AJV82391.1 Sec10p [Saccharomyces cerevisiae YJM693]CAI4624055.1 CPG_1a_G0036690.mRNA.1.CDS.1 [Saccharomyces cerevisiae]CAI4632097.1 AIE_G0036490.mRNA.1.CDS.1 [Saccharomyces cerevisiae]